MALFQWITGVLLVLLGLFSDNTCQGFFDGTDPLADSTTSGPPADAKCASDDIHDHFFDRCRKLYCPFAMKPEYGECQPIEDQSRAIEAKMKVKSVSNNFDMATLGSMSDGEFSDFSAAIFKGVGDALNLSGIECKLCGGQAFYQLVGSPGDMFNDPTTTLPSMALPLGPMIEPPNTQPEGLPTVQEAQPPINNTLTFIITILPIPEKGCSVAAVVHIFQHIADTVKTFTVSLQGESLTFELSMAYGTLDDTGMVQHKDFNPPVAFRGCENIDSLEAKFYCPSLEIDPAESPPQEIHRANFLQSTRPVLMPGIVVEDGSVRWMVCVDKYFDLGPGNGGSCIRSLLFVSVLGVLVIDVSVAFG